MSEHQGGISWCDRVDKRLAALEAALLGNREQQTQPADADPLGDAKYLRQLLDAERKDREKQTAKLANELEMKEREIGNARTKAIQQDIELNALRKERDNWKHEVAALNCENLQLRSQIDQLRAQLVDAKRKLDLQEKELAMARLAARTALG